MTWTGSLKGVVNQVWEDEEYGELPGEAVA
jgi:hypothetical protein